MNTPRADEAVLAKVRVLDLTDQSALLAGQLLAELGADVVQVMPPGGVVGDPQRVRAYCRGKQLLALNVAQSAAALESLLNGADVLIESFHPQIAQRLGLAPAAVAARHPHLIHVSITPFGGVGPKANYAATDLTITAASGFLLLSGAAGAAPLRISEPQAHAHGAADAAVAVLIALRARSANGCGQHIDISAQHSLTLALLGRELDAAVGQPGAQRSSGYGQIGAVRVRNLYAVQDGWVLVSAGILPPVAPFMRRLMSWAAEEGHCDADVVAWDWGSVAMRMMQGEITAAAWAPVDAAIAALLAPLTKQQVMAAAVQRKLLLAPVLHVGELLDSPQFTARGFVQRPAEAAPHLGPFAHMHGSVLQQPNEISEVRLADLQSRWPRRAPPAAPAASAPLAGLKVLDLFWVVAGPGATRMLADYGATVVHVESRTRLDMLRSVPPYLDGVPEPERSAGFHSTNANKMNMSLDLGSAAGRQVLSDLIRWADVLGESFSPGVIERLGFGYEAVRRLNPRLIMISSSLLGQTGPWRDYAGFGNLAGAVSGFHQLTGYPGEAPAGCYGPYTDFMGVRFNALAILAALAHRDRTGEGQYIDMAQAEAALHFLAPTALAYLEHRIIPAPRGNRDPLMAPHGVFPTAGDDQWIAIAVRDDDEWRRLCGHAEMLDLASDPTLATLAGRQQAEARIEATLSRWTAPRSGSEIEVELQRLGIPAHRLLDTHALAHEPQLVSRGHILRVSHPQFGASAIAGSRIHLSAASPAVPAAAVSYGSHNSAVLRDLLGYSSEQINALSEQGVLQ